MTSRLPHRLHLLGLNVHPLSREHLMHTLWDWAVQRNAPRRMYYTNAHVFNLGYRDKHVRALLNSADLLIVEGFGGKIGGLLAGVHFPEQLATMDWMDEFLAGLVERGSSRLFLVGDEPGIAEECAVAMEMQHPGLTVSGFAHGYFKKDGQENQEVITAIIESHTDVLLVGMGTPIQEEWIETYLHELQVPLVLCLGAMFRWYSGAERRAPPWMRRLHAEWLHRFLKHPVRHFRRYAIGNPIFLIRCLRQRILGLSRSAA